MLDSATLLNSFVVASEGGGLPQLTQTDTFIGQIFWLLVFFLLLYLIVSRFIVPRISDVMEERQDRVDDDLARAERLKAEAEEVMAEYEAALSEARGEAHELLKQAQDELNAKAAEREKAFNDKLNATLKQAEENIGKAKAEALANIKSVASEVAVAATEKLIGKGASSEAASKAVEEVSGGKS